VSALCFFSAPANAATRTVYFNQSGMNKTVNGLAAPGADSTCKITISNPSTVSQTFTLNANVSSLDKWAGGESGTSTTGFLCSPGGCTSATSGGSISCTGLSCTGSLAAGANVQATFQFSHYPARTNNVAGTQNIYQKLRCSGSIVATDVSSPGFLIASGVLVTFVESAKMSTDGVTSGSKTPATFGGIAVYTQVPISINRSKPF